MRTKVLCGWSVVLLAVALVPATSACAAAGRAEGARGRPPETAERPAPPPKIAVIRFENIPAQSFIETLKQLGRDERVGELLRQMPMALNDPANAVVVIAPPEAVERLTALAKELDKPAVFQQRMRQQKMQDRESRAKMEREGIRPPKGPPTSQPTPKPGGPALFGKPGAGTKRLGPGGPMREMGPRPGMGPRLGGPMRETGPRPEMEQRPGGPVREMGPRLEMEQRPGGLMAITSPEAIRELHLSDDQVNAINQALDKFRRYMEEVREQMRGSLEEGPPAERPERMRGMSGRVMEEREKAAEKLRDQIVEILKPDQRRDAQKWLEARRPGPRPAMGPISPRRMEEPERPPIVPAGSEGFTRFWRVV